MLLHVLAQTGQTGGDFPYADLIRYGVMPVTLIVLLVTGVFRIGSFVDKQSAAAEKAAGERLAAEKDRAEKAERRADAAEDRERRIRDAAADIGPAFQQTSATMERVLDYLLRGGLPPPAQPPPPGPRA